MHPTVTGRSRRPAYAILAACLLALPLAAATPRAAPSAPSPALPTPSTKAEGYRGIWFELGQKFPLGDKYSGGLGTYTANHVPMAVYAPAVNKTFFTYGGTPAADQRQLVILVSYYDHERRTVPAPTVVHVDPGVNDPHDDASLQIDEGGHIWIFKSGRGRRRPGAIYRSETPYSIDRFQLLAQPEMTYPQPWVQPAGGFLLLFTKYTQGRELYWKTSGNGEAWTEDRKLAGFGGHYQVSGQHGAKIATFFNYHPGGNVDKRTNLYYAQSEDHGQTWTTAAGRPLTLPLSQPQNDALVFDYEAEGRLMYTCDLNFDAQGRPVLLYVTSRSAAPGPEGDPREWVLARWRDGAWSSQVVTRSTHNYDMGSLYIEGAAWRIIAPTEAGPQPHGTGGEMALWVSRDAGDTWRRERLITQGSPFNHSYARRPVQARDPFFAFWADGHADRFSPSRLYFTDSAGRQVYQLPYDMQGRDHAVPPLWSASAERANP